MQHQRKYSPQIIAIVTAAIAIGAAAGAGASTALYITRSSDLSAKLANATSRVMVLESLLQVASDSPAAADLQIPHPAPTANTAAADEAFAAALPTPDLPSPATAASAAPASSVEVASKTTAAEQTPRAEAPPSTKRQVEEDPRRRETSTKPTQIASSKPGAKAASVTPASVPTPPEAPTTSAAATAPTPVSAAVPVSQEDVARATARNPVVGVNADKLGVAKLTAAGVQLRSGATIKIGDHFASGERLLSVDPVNNRIVTSARQVLVFFGS